MKETKLDANPLTFEIPESLKPFRLRIQVDNVGGKDDIAFIDNVQYEGKLCKIVGYFMGEMKNSFKFLGKSRGRGATECERNEESG